ncbi:uncharacterized protein LOC133203384 [Saccostrea echinata]|uniref:uncharacterized protein LOC133203384 n=1 Tax=Saccostrea echinata TaxID=191078 RepID=UPI002A80BCAD|nr:uncharacterized protein LOC133203384 [Saccostrea echinata]
MGSIQRDNDIWTEYGGVAYTYNETSVILIVPAGKSIGRIIYTGGLSFNGVFDGSFTSGKVRIRVWRLFDWPKPDFVHNCNLIISTAEPYKLVTHSLRRLPDFVTVQLILDDGFVADGQGVTTVTEDDTFTNHVCGVLFGISTTSITLWVPNKNEDYVICYNDGWGNISRVYDSARVVIRAWILSNADIVQRESFPYSHGDLITGTVPTMCYLDPDNYIVIVEVKDASISDGKVFYAAGTASLGKINDPFGGVVYGYNETDVLLWTPSVTNGYLIYVDGIWGDGTETLRIYNVQISVTIISTNNSVHNVTAINIDDVVQDLTVSKKTTSTYIRSLVSVYDPRPSAKAMGAVGVTVLCLVLGLIVLADCDLLIRKLCLKNEKN